MAGQLVTSNWLSGPDFLWEKELSTQDMTVGKVIHSAPKLRKVQVHNTKAKEERTLLDRLTKFSDWK